MRKTLLVTLFLFVLSFSLVHASAAVSFEQGTIEATGVGISPSGAYGTQATALAKRAAIVDAYRNLAEIIQGVQVDATTTVYNLQVANDVVQTKVSSLIRGAKVVNEVSNPDGSYQVTMQLPMYGNNSLAAVIYPVITDKAPDSLPLPTTTIRPATATYTGVIVDARGLGLEPTFSPSIYDTSGRQIYGNKYINADYAISYGMVEYTIDDAMFSDAANGKYRAGTFPLIIKAVGKRDRCNVVVSVEDGDKILSSAQQDNFLSMCAVVFSR